MTRTTLPAAVLFHDDPRAANAARVVPFEANVERLGGCVLGYTKSPARGGEVPTRHSYTLIEMTGRGYRNALTMLIAYRRAHGIVVEDLSGWCTVIADIAAAIKGPGMTLQTVENQAVTIGIDIPGEVLTPFVQRAAQWRRSVDYHPLTGAEVGRLVKLSWQERDDLGIKRIAAFDETPDACRRRKNAAAQAARRAARGATPRAPASVTATKWEKLGISKSSYYARGLHRLDPKIIDSQIEGNDDVPVQNPGNDDATVQDLDSLPPAVGHSRGNDDVPVQNGGGK